MNTAEKIAVMQAYLDGKTIQYQGCVTSEVSEFSMTPSGGDPEWDWSTRAYWIKPNKLDKAYDLYVAAAYSPGTIFPEDVTSNIKNGLRAVLDAKL